MKTNKSRKEHPCNCLSRVNFEKRKGCIDRARTTTVNLSLELTVLAAVAGTPEVGAQPEREEKLGGKQTGASTCRVCMRTVTWPYRLLWFSILEQRT